MTQPTALAGVIGAMLAAAADLGLSRDELLTTASLAHSDFEDAHARVGASSVAALDAAIHRRLGQGAAVRMGEAMAQRGELLVDYICAATHTLREFFEHMGHYAALNLDIARPTLEVRNGYAFFGCIYPQDLVDRLPLTIEREFAHWLTSACKACGEFVPLEVHLQTPASDDMEYRRVFRAPVHNRTPGCWLVFAANLLDLRIAGSDRTLLNHLKPIAETLLAGLHTRRSFAGIVRAAMLKLIAQGGVSIDDVARDLATSPRTLQRRLENEGTTFGAVFDEVRRAAALEYLKNPQLAIKEAAYLVGFSEPSTFYRAFRRWTGATPSTYRRSLAI